MNDSSQLDGGVDQDETFKGDLLGREVLMKDIWQRRPQEQAKPCARGLSPSH